MIEHHTKMARDLYHQQQALVWWHLRFSRALLAVSK